MSLILSLLAPVFAAGLVALNALLVLRGPGPLRKLGRTALRMLHRHAESVRFWTPPPAAAAELPWMQKFLRTPLGLWVVCASSAFLALWFAGWVSPQERMKFVWHLISSWVGGILLAGLVAGLIWSVFAAWSMSRAQLYAARAGLSRFWIARPLRIGSEFGQALQKAIEDSHRIELLDFTGFELVGKGPTECGGVMACLLAKFPTKEVRVLLFNPCARQIDPDRKHNTVMQSQLSLMELSREAFESKLRETLDRIEILNQSRARPIEVRLYSEKPSFRILVAGEHAYLGTLDPRDVAGEFPLYEALRQSEGPSLHTAARAHFLRVWGDSVPVTVEQASTVEDLQVEPVVETPMPVSRAG